MLRATTQSIMRTEVDALSRFRHPNILSLMGYCLEPPCIVFPLMERLSLYTNLHEYNAIKVILICSHYIIVQVNVCILADSAGSDLAATYFSVV